MSDDAPDNVIEVEFRSSEQAASAGTGVYLDDERMIITKVSVDALPKDFQRNSDRYFGVPVAGESMEPLYHNGDMLIVSKEPVNVGEIGVFTMGGQGYVKKLNSGELISLNSAYDPITMDESIVCNGKVVGVLNADAVKE